MIDRWAGVVGRHARWVLVCAVLVVVAAAGYGAGVFDSLGRGGFEDPAAEGYRAVEAEQAIFGNHGVDVVAIYSSDELTADDPEFREAVEAVLTDLDGPEVVGVSPTSPRHPRPGRWSPRTATRPRSASRSPVTRSTRS